MTSSFTSRLSGFLPEPSHHLLARAVADQVLTRDALPVFITDSILQAGVISGENPAKYSPNDPFALWVIQLGTSLLFSTPSRRPKYTPQSSS